MKNPRWDRANAVGTLHERSGWREARDAGIDLVELRVDSLPAPPSPEDIRALGLPAIVTVRDPREGGARALPLAARRELYLELLGAAAAIDLEARNLGPMRELVSAARQAGVRVIASMHDFRGTPPARTLVGRARRALDAGAEIVKIATTVARPRQVRELLAVFDAVPAPLAVMGMGSLGRASRLLFAACGSCLNYGWLGKPQVDGQWRASELAAWMRAAGL